MRNIIAIIIFSSFSNFSQAENADYCTDVNRWATSIAYTQLKNSGYVTPETVDFTKTSIERIAQEKIGGDLFKQVHHVIFTLKDGSTIKVITVNDASSEECSMSGVDIYVVSKQL
ncbi:hypothetical protein [Marinobacterium sedimentorum]|uniref:hypothetical protein n=1 Tax=Marinobacterium sedimentorum TaxID=2927804 RepID=UPI0020C6B07F|nr:hypothetical protein [Marinobacterium sedimentorum]MCP8688376.1 hypothetical protein [Marinobacterium sedimentorum]